MLSTRIDPPFRLGRLRVRDQIVEVRDADLRFDTDEASGLLGSVTRSLGRALLDRLCDRTEGWAAGLVLAGLSTTSRLGLAEPGGGRPAALVEQLTEREMAVLRYLPADMSQRGIASELYVSLNTVKTHCRAIYRKLGVGDRKAAVQAARDLDLL